KMYAKPRDRRFAGVFQFADFLTQRIGKWFTRIEDIPLGIVIARKRPAGVVTQPELPDSRERDTLARLNVSRRQQPVIFQVARRSLTMHKGRCGQCYGSRTCEDPSDSV